jgi:hypothetical protein
MKTICSLPLLFCFVLPFTVFAENKMGDLSALLTDTGEYEFLVEFDTRLLKENNQGLRTMRGLAFNDARIRSDTAKELQNLKHTVMSAFQPADFTVTHQY